MKLQRVKIENFRGIKSLELELGELTVLIGENNTGKSTVLEALKVLIDRSRGARRITFSKDDFHRPDGDTTLDQVKPIKITLHYFEDKVGEWSDALIAIYGDVIQTTRDDRKHINVQITAEHTNETKYIPSQILFLDEAGVRLKNQEQALVRQLQRASPLFYLSALREAEKQFKGRGLFWDQMMKDISVPDEQAQAIQAAVENANQSIVANHRGLSAIAKNVSASSESVSLHSEDPVSFRALPTNVDNIVNQIRMNLKSFYGVELPLSLHGEGAKNLAVIMLFQAYIETEGVLDASATSILALEEPEAHLHPSAIRFLGKQLKQIAGNSSLILTSHSGDTISQLPLSSIYRLYKKGGETKVGRVKDGLLTPQQEKHFNYRIRQTRGGLLLARCWLLVEGETECHLYPHIAESMGVDFDEKSVAVIEFAPIGGPDTYIKVAEALGIDWQVVVDGDSDGQKYAKKARLASKIEPGVLDEIVVGMLSKNVEHEFWNHGYQDFYESKIGHTKLAQARTNAKDDAEVMASEVIKESTKKPRSKPLVALELVDEIKRRLQEQGIEKALPHRVREVIEQVNKMASSG